MGVAEESSEEIIISTNSPKGGDGVRGLQFF